MSYSCSDFTDDINRALGVTLEQHFVLYGAEDDSEDTELSAQLAIAEIHRLQKAEKDGIDARQLLADLWAESARHLLETSPTTFIRLRDQVLAMNLPQPTIPF